ncbi:helix-turn-helix domain-containing protein [Spirosoma panaciterrae]|uniref:helix-turn-helix domain-containing protein n=1 Tax=Spirosoma panaciterrae TaxID=496058 RepID=UPI0009FBF866|nr:helix-turn-helix domain-containing protein [Spirosoma panaciterrae]
MQNVVFTQLSIPEVRQLLRQELEQFFTDRPFVSSTSTLPIEDLYTRQETAQKLKISLPTLDDYTRRGIIRGCRVGRRVLYRPEWGGPV